MGCCPHLGSLGQAAEGGAALAGLVWGRRGQRAQKKDQRVIPFVTLILLLVPLIPPNPIMGMVAGSSDGQWGRHSPFNLRALRRAGLSLLVVTVINVISYIIAISQVPPWARHFIPTLIFASVPGEEQFHREGN